MWNGVELKNKKYDRQLLKNKTNIVGKINIILKILFPYIWLAFNSQIYKYVNN